MTVTLHLSYTDGRHGVRIATEENLTLVMETRDKNKNLRIALVVTKTACSDLSIYEKRVLHLLQLSGTVLGFTN